MEQVFTITNKGAPSGNAADSRPLEVKESRAGGPRTEIVMPGESKDFAVNGSSRVVVSERGAA